MKRMTMGTSKGMLVVGFKELSDGVYIHFGTGWRLLEARNNTWWIGIETFASFASAKIAAQRRAVGLELPYKGECRCSACKGIPRSVWNALKHPVQ